jgi:hypothetical protein
MATPNKGGSTDCSHDDPISNNEGPAWSAGPSSLPKQMGAWMS